MNLQSTESSDLGLGTSGDSEENSEGSWKLSNNKEEKNKKSNRNLARPLPELPAIEQNKQFEKSKSLKKPAISGVPGASSFLSTYNKKKKLDQDWIN